MAGLRRRYVALGCPGCVRDWRRERCLPERAVFCAWRQPDVLRGLGGEDIRILVMDCASHDDRPLALLSMINDHVRRLVRSGARYL